MSSADDARALVSAAARIQEAVHGAASHAWRMREIQKDAALIRALLDRLTH